MLEYLANAIRDCDDADLMRNMREARNRARWLRERAEAGPCSGVTFKLHGYSVSGWGGLSYVNDDTYAAAMKAERALLRKHPKDPSRWRKRATPVSRPAEVGGK